MATNVRYLSIMAFPQEWTGSELRVNVLLLPSGDPTQPVQNELPFMSAQPVLQAVLVKGLVTPCWDESIVGDPAKPNSDLRIPLPLFHVTDNNVDPAIEEPGLLQPASKYDLFKLLAGQLNPVVLSPQTSTAFGIKKDLPPSYHAAGGTSPADNPCFAMQSGYGCDLRRNPAVVDPARVPSKQWQWGQIFSHALRQPRLGQTLGLIYQDVRVPVAPEQLADGGWLWFEIDTKSPANWYSKLVTNDPKPVRLYAARLPPIRTPQPLFAAVLFPTYPTKPKDNSHVLDEAQFEADAYLDGFAKIVHAHQPDSADAITGSDQRLAPGTDAGFQLGWDDVQVTTWLQRQLQTAQDLASSGGADEFPLGVLGYRVDVRWLQSNPSDAQNANPWVSLVRVNTTLSATSDHGIMFPQDGPQELVVEPTPVRAGQSTSFWLPRYFAHWRGRSLVVKDPYAYAFSGGRDLPQGNDSLHLTGTITDATDPLLRLRYGEWYQFRVRLADLTGGGPASTDEAKDAGVVTVPFLRHVPPKAVSVAADRKSSPQTLTVTRPRLHYPEMVFARPLGAGDAETDLTNLLTDLKSKAIKSVAQPDPDVVTLEVIVEARAPVGDTGHLASLADMNTSPETGDLDDGYRVVYRHQIPFMGDQLTLRVAPTACSQIRLMKAPEPGATTLPVPTARNLRIRLRGLGSGALDYWGSSIASTGLVTDVLARYEEPVDDQILAQGTLTQQLQAFYLREDPATSTHEVVAQGMEQAFALAGADESIARDVGKGLQKSLALGFRSSAPTPIENLARALGLPFEGQTISAPPGRRILFGAQSTLRHCVPQDGSSITFSSLKDLIGHWIVVIRLTLDRDWTYSGIVQKGSGHTGYDFTGGASPLRPAPRPMGQASGLSGFMFRGFATRDKTLLPLLRLTPHEIGRIPLPEVISKLATQATSDETKGETPRDQTDLVFFATVNSTVPQDEFPDLTYTAWAVTAHSTHPPSAQPLTLWSSGEALELPITAPPRQMPKLASAGIAESTYLTDPTYASTQQRKRALWFEFDVPPADPNDSYFFRILSYGPDPLMISGTADYEEQTEPSLPIDPEWIRMIAAGDRNDDAGKNAMTELVGAKTPLALGGKPIHYIVPVPDTMTESDLNMFGFWTMEVRVGHKLWSTAQARYGRPLRVAGVQYPPPPLAVNVERLSVPIPQQPTQSAQEAIWATADLARTVRGNVSLTKPWAPQTEIWFLLYAQVKRVDGQAWRNLLLAKVRGELQLPVLPPSPKNPYALPQVLIRSIPVAGVFSMTAVVDLLHKLGLPDTTPTSVLAVELFPENAKPDEPSQTAPDPLGTDLGTRRVLRVSPLTPIRSTCQAG